MTGVGCGWYGLMLPDRGGVAPVVCHWFCFCQCVSYKGINQRLLVALSWEMKWLKSEDFGIPHAIRATLALNILPSQAQQTFRPADSHLDRRQSCRVE